ncbi:uncharacterized protein LOC118434434 [Folsomia candida]|nr:uncharacterized protein LOC118434434 [Folsomia candida]
MVSSFQSVYAHILTTFKEPYFQGRGFPVGRSVSRFSANFGDNVESLIISGSTPWTIVSFKGLTYCLTPTFDKATISFPICVFTTMNDTVIGKDTFWESIKPGCTSKSKVVKVNSCFSFSEAAKVVESPKGPRLEDVVNEAKRVILPAITECNKNEDFLTILDLRINNDFSSPLQMRFPKNKNDAWRTTLIDTVFDITIHSFPMVDPNLQRMLNEMFVYVIEKDVWSKGSGRPKEHTEDPEISSIASELEVCLELLSTNDNIHQVIDMVKEYLDFVESMPLIDTSERSEYIKGVLMEDFKRNITFDFMMEMIWLASNQVASACHIASGEGSNFWIDFYPIFKDMYLTPMIKFWSNPSNFERYYPHFFGGMQFNVQYEYMALCSSYYRTMSHLDIYSRPSELSLKKQ